MTINSTTAPRRLPVFTRDEHGQPIAVITLANGTTARLDLIDWESLLQRGVSPNWTLNSVGGGFAYVRAKTPGQRAVMIAREITGAQPRQIAGYRNGDRTDLRRSNLTLTTGGRAKAFEERVASGKPAARPSSVHTNSLQTGV